MSSKNHKGAVLLINNNNVKIIIFRFIQNLLMMSLNQWCVGKLALMHSICQLLWCRYSHHGQLISSYQYDVTGCGDEEIGSIRKRYTINHCEPVQTNCGTSLHGPF